ncbi:MAG: tetratricopeptide repeat protein [Gammaproteobacteria bacterium]
MKHYSRLTPLLLLVFAGCAQVKDDSPTLKSLERRNISVEKDTTIPDSRSKAIEQYQSIAGTANDKSVQREAKRKIADLEVDNAESIFLGKIKKSQQDAQTSAPPPPADNRNAINLYQELLQEQAPKSDAENTLYQLAKAYEQSGDYQNTLQTLTRLANAYPKIGYMDEVQFRRGEILFTLKDYAQAEKAYASLFPLKKSQFYEMALYKHGWSLYKQEQYLPALGSFFAILDKKFPVNKAVADDFVLPRGEQEFVKDTLHVTSLSFYHLNGAESIDSYLSAKGYRPYEHLLYKSLGELALEKDRVSDAVNSYRAFIKAHPGHPYSVLMQQRIIDAYKRPEFVSLLLPEKREFVRVYDDYNQRRISNSTKTYTEHLIYGDKIAQDKITSYLRVILEDLARHYHAEAQKSKARAAYKEAMDWYTKFLKNFPEDNDAPGITFLLAESLYENGRYADAVTRYENVAYDIPANQNGAEAGYAALLAYQKHGEKLSGYEKNLWRRNAVVSAMRFSEKYPKDKRVPAILVSAMEELFSLKQYDKAEFAARRILKMEPPADIKQRSLATTIIAHTEFERDNFDRAEASYREALNLLPAGDPGRVEIMENLASAIYRQGEQSRTAGDMPAAIQHFLRVGAAAPASPIRLSAEYDAAVGYMSLNDWGNALRIFSQLQKTYPDNAFQTDVSRQMVTAYLQLDQPAKAAAELEKTIASNKDASVRQDATWQAAELYEKAKDTKNAAKVYGLYVEQFPSPLEQAIEARNRLAEAYKQGNDASMQNYWLKDIIKADREGGAERTPRTRQTAAHAAITLADLGYQAFTQARLVEPLQQNLKIKKEKMEAALRAYGTAAEFGVADVTTAATYQMAKIYSDLSRDLLESQRPEGLTPEEREQYDVLLEEQAFPFEEKAIQIYESNIRRVSAGIYDESVRKSFSELGKLLPVKYAKHEKSEPLTGITLKNDGKDEDEKILINATAQVPPNVEAYNHLGIHYRDNGRFDDARNAYEKALVIDPNHSSIHLNLGILYDLYLRDTGKALEQYRLYQGLLPTADKQVGMWIADLEKRHNGAEKTAGVTDK